MTKQINTESGIVLLLDMPVGANRLKIFNDERPYLSYFLNNDTFREYLPEGNWQGKHFKEMREEECEVLVDTTLMYKKHKVRVYKFKSYRQGFMGFQFASLALESLIIENGFNPENTVVLIKQAQQGYKLI